jgi:hypothetical protein
MSEKSIKGENKPVAVVLDYQEYLKLEEYRQDVIDYNVGSTLYTTFH